MQTVRRVYWYPYATPAELESGLRGANTEAISPSSTARIFWILVVAGVGAGVGAGIGALHSRLA